MAIVNPPGWLENSGPTNTAQQLRSYIGMLLDMPVGTFIPYGGVHRTAGQQLVVSQTTTPTMDVVVGSGAAIVPGTQNSQQGAYFVINDAPVTLTVSPSEPSLPRIDIVQLRVRDDFYSGVVRDAILDIKKGTPASSPSAPTPDDNAIVLAEIMVPASATSISNANITDKRPFFSPFARSGSILETDFQITSEHPDLDDDAFAVKRITETNNRWKVKTNGEMWWGPGSSSQDTNLYRAAANTLKTDDTFEAASANIHGPVTIDRSTVGDGLIVKQSADSSGRVFVRNDARIVFGDGAGTNDTNLYRGGANLLVTDDTFRILGETQPERSIATANAIVVGVNGDSIKRFLVRADGLLAWGDGTNSRDTNLYRSAANTLRTDDNFHVQGSLTVNGGVNVPSNRPLPGTCVARLRRTSSSTVALEDPIPWDAEDWDTLGAHASGSASYVPNVAGKYRVTAIVTTQPIGSGSALIARVRKNGSVQSTVTATSNSSPSAGNGWMISDVVQCNGTSDSIDVTVSNNAGTAVNAAGSVLTITYEGP